MSLTILRVGSSTFGRWRVLARNTILLSKTVKENAELPKRIGPYETRTTGLFVDGA